MNPSNYSKQYQVGDTILIYHRPDGSPNLGIINRVADNGVDAVEFVGQRFHVLSGLWHIEDERINSDKELNTVAWERGIFIDSEHTRIRKDIPKQFKIINNRITNMHNTLDLLNTPNAALSPLKRKRKHMILASLGQLAPEQAQSCLSPDEADSIQDDDNEDGSQRMAVQEEDDDSTDSEEDGLRFEPVSE